MVIPAGDRFCWVTVGEQEPEPLNLYQVEEVVGVDNQVQEDAAEPVHEDVGADAVENKETRERAESVSGQRGKLLEPEEDAL